MTNTNFLRSLWAQTGLSQRELATHINVSEGRLRAALRGKESLSIGATSRLVYAATFIDLEAFLLENLEEIIEIAKNSTKTK